MSDDTKQTKDSDQNSAVSSQSKAAESQVPTTDLPTQTQPSEAKADNRPLTPNKGKWYVIHTYSGHENKAAAAMRQRISTMNLGDKIFEIIVPTRNIVVVRHGKKEETKEKIFPGYILVRMDLDDESWLAVRTTPGVTAFVGVGNKPTPIADSEVATIVQFSKLEAPKFKTKFSKGEAVKIIDGPFADFLGTIDTIDEEKGKVKVLVSIFGRETPVELDFLQITKL